jgi:hypothetical protein
MYEMQAELVSREVKKEVAEREAAEMSSREFEQPLVPADTLARSMNPVGSTEQATFGWYE